jgi:tetratricopeptide (TPR) repeat protein
MVPDTTMNIVVLLEQQRFEEAEAALRMLVTTSPEDGPLHALRALCLLELEQWHEALAAARRATLLGPEVAYCHWALATVRIRCHEFRKARVAAAKAVGLDPDTADYQYVLARAEAADAHWQAALGALDRAVQLEPGRAAYLALHAVIVEHRDGRVGPSGDLLAVLKQDPEDTIARAGRGWAALHEQPAHTTALAVAASTPRPLSVAGMFTSLVSRWLGRWLRPRSARRKAA